MALAGLVFKSQLHPVSRLQSKHRIGHACRLGSPTERWKLGIWMESCASIQGSYKVFSYPHWTSEHLTPLLRYALLLELKIFILFLISYVCVCLWVGAHRGQKC